MNRSKPTPAAGRNRYHSETGLRRIQLYLDRAAIDALDIDNEMVLRDDLGRAVSKPSERIGQLLDIYRTVVAENMPALPVDDWARRFDLMRQSGRPPLEASRRVIEALPDTLHAMAVADAFRRFEAFDPALPLRDRLVAAGCKVTEPPTHTPKGNR